MAEIKPTVSHRRLPRRLRKLIGSWALEGSMPAYDHPIRGSSTIKWLVKDALLGIRTTARGMPPSDSVIGADDVNNNFTMLYSDGRPVVRRYEMTLTGRRWTLLRRAPGFSQRFVGYFSKDHRRITARWEKSADGRRWELDLRLVYTKRKGPKR